MNRILVIKLCCVGDVLFTTPAVRALRKGSPHAHLAYLVGSWSSQIIEDNPNVDEVIVYDPPAHSSSRWRALVSTLNCLRRLRKRRFDLAVSFHRTSLSSLFALLAGIPKRVGFQYAGQGKFLTHRVAFDPEKHEVDRYLDLVTSLGIQPAGRSTEMNVTSEQERYAADLLRNNGVGDDDELIGILPGGGKNPGTSMPTKRWQPAKFVRLADALIQQYRAKVILVGGPGDEQVAEEVASDMKEESINLVGKTSFKQLAAVLKRCSLFIGGDSGPLHMAAAVGTPTVGIFGPSDPRLVAPRGEKHLAIWKNVSCGPCYRPDTVVSGRDFSRCPEKTLRCMEEITIQEVQAAVRQQMDKTDGEINLTD